jgi:hypothetical protein
MQAQCKHCKSLSLSAAGKFRSEMKTAVGTEQTMHMPESLCSVHTSQLKKGDLRELLMSVIDKNARTHTHTKASSSLSSL